MRAVYIGTTYTIAVPHLDLTKAIMKDYPAYEPTTKCRTSYRTRELTVSEIQQAGKSLDSSSSLFFFLDNHNYLANHSSYVFLDKSTPY